MEKTHDAQNIHGIYVKLSDFFLLNKIIIPQWPVKIFKPLAMVLPTTICEKE